MVPPFAMMLLATTPVLAAVGAARSQPRAQQESARYQNCLALGSSNPAAALAEAEQWSRSGGSAPADHCAALALVALKRYGEAGQRLDRAARAKELPSLSYRVELFSQAGNAWLLAGDGAKAVQSFTAALTLSPGDADLFSDLARAHAMRRNWREVDMDLSAALQVNPRRPDLLVLRASARRALQHYADAHADIAAALKLKPNDAGALLERGLLRKQLGDTNGARRDFAMAAKAPDREVALTAQDQLDSLK